MPDGGPPLDALRVHFQPRQWLAFTTWATELLFGGAAFGGKSHFLRLAAIMWCSEIPGLQVYLFRRVEDELIKNHMEGPQGFRQILAPWVGRWVDIVEKEIRFWNGSRIYLCHCKDEKHRFRYHGDEIHVLLIDELTTFTELIFRYLRFRVRMVGINLPAKYRKGEIGPDGKTRNPTNLFPRVVCSSNPGNIGHHWVKRTFGLESAAGISRPTLMPDIEGGLHRQYIHSRYRDNPIGMEDDPHYLARMRGLGDPALVKAMEEGDWNLIAGGFFPEFSLARHVLKAVTLPANFNRRFRAVDWGSARPSSTGFYAIMNEDWKAEGTLGNPILVPRGSILRYREWYTKKEGQDNVGQRLTAETWAAGVLQRSGTEEFRYNVVDTSMFDEDGGPSLAERAMKVELNGKKLGVLRPADKRREPGWDQCRARLNPSDSDDPFFFCMDNQPDFIRVIQSVQHDEKYVEDLDTDQEDHPVDEWRYACMSRPRPIDNTKPKKPKGPLPWTFDWILQQTGQPSPSRSTYRMD